MLFLTSTKVFWELIVLWPELKIRERCEVFGEINEFGLDQSGKFMKG